MLKKFMRFAFLTAFLFVLSSCQTTTLAAPTGLALSERTVTWNAVDGAAGYVLKIGDVEHPVDAPAFTLPADLYGVVSLSVKAVFEASSSPWSEVVFATAVIRLAVPQNIVQDGNVIIWDEVDYATGYVVKIGGVEYPTTVPLFETTIETPADFQVLAVGRSDGFITSSAFSPVFRLKVTLPAPGNIRLAEGVIVWDSVAGAAAYVILVDADEYASETTEIDLQYNYAGEHEVQIKAISGDEDAADSGFASAVLDFPLLTLLAPDNVAYADGTLTFDVVVGANAYDILVNGESYASMDVTSYQVPAEVLLDPSAYLQVVATSLVHLPSSPSLRVYLSATVVTTEAELRAVTGGAVIITADISLTAPWIPLDFTGVFDGGGHIVRNVDITADLMNVGFFGSLDGALVKDLTIIGTINVSPATAGVNVGGLAGRVTNSDISGVTVQIDVSVDATSGVGYAGGVFGTLSDTDVDYVLYAGSVDTAWMTTGGFAGRFDASAGPASVYRTIVLGNVTGNGGEQTPTGGFAGIMLDNQLEIRECGVWSTVAGTGYVGGFAGYIGYGTIFDSYVHGEVIAGPMDVASLVHTGGFAGRVEGYNVSIVRCLAIANVTWNNESPDVNVGGFAGSTPGGTYADIYEHCGYSDTSLDRIGNPDTGRGDGIGLLGPVVLEAIALAAPGVWDFNGAEIRLAWEYGFSKQQNRRG